jgi:hypothetical protein|tara:strand:- start:392 stop:523 length:132 start_codon:yes stop_codon:yes gene_type:complete
MTTPKNQELRFSLIQFKREYASRLALAEAITQENKLTSLETLS